MNFSEDWKSLLGICSVHSPPLLLSGRSAEPLGPLLFSPSPSPSPTTLFSSPSLRPPFSPTPSLSLYTFLHSRNRPSKDPFLPSLASSIALDFDHHHPSSSSSSSSDYQHNALQMLRFRGHGKFLLFFPSGDNWDRLGFLHLCMVEGSKTQVVADSSGQEFRSPQCLGSRIIDIQVISDPNMGDDDTDDDDDDVTSNVGFLLARTLYSVHWFRVKASDDVGASAGKPALEYMGTKQFGVCVASACWNPHLIEESLVLLENGELYLFDFVSRSKTDKFPLRLEGSRVPINWKDVDFDSGVGAAARLDRWLKAEFSWHPLIFAVACSNAVFMVDYRFQESKVTALAHVSMLNTSLSDKNDQFISFCKVPSDGFYFSIATQSHLFLFDIRKPLMPVLHWDHGFEKPNYMNIFRLSELRCLREESRYQWASENGYAIMLGSFFNCEFNLFCFGPPLPTPFGSVASEVLRLGSSMYAWELPSELPMMDRWCYCGDCILEKEFSRTMLPEWVDWRQKEELVMGFCIIADNSSESDSEPKTSDVGGFTMIKLVSSGNLKARKYYASWDSIRPSSKAREKASSCDDGSELYLVGDQNYKYQKRFKYFCLEYLARYLNGDLSQFKALNMQKLDAKLKYSSEERHGSKHDLLKVARFDTISSSSSSIDVLNSVGLPMSIYEIASSRMWATIPVDLIQLAFSNYLEFSDVFVDEKKKSMQFLKVPNQPQFLPFFLRKPSSESNRFSHKAQLDDAFIGPVLPLPILFSLSDVGKDKEGDYAVGEDEMNGVAEEKELMYECEKVWSVANGVSSSGSCAELGDLSPVSLAADGTKKSNPYQEPNQFIFFKPRAYLNDESTKLGSIGGKPVNEVDNFNTFIYKVQDEEFSSNPKNVGGLEMFDELCPVKLKFGIPPMDIGRTERKGYNVLKRQFSKWQGNFKQYGDFCKASKMKKGAT
ncbi:hypothetical protein Sjap_013271 [Stephania japonica]|uniref:Uncharacterized protein n=1 Tax=Stephania japonica TaxID=461633 RepID=A0AAP0NYZ9_9MAGN